jgi:hypothetical protein
MAAEYRPDTRDLTNQPEKDNQRHAAKRRRRADLFRKSLWAKHRSFLGIDPGPVILTNLIRWNLLRRWGCFWSSWCRLYRCVRSGCWRGKFTRLDFVGFSGSFCVDLQGCLFAQFVECVPIACCLYNENDLRSPFLSESPKPFNASLRSETDLSTCWVASF